MWQSHYKKTRSSSELPHFQVELLGAYSVFVCWDQTIQSWTTKACHFYCGQTARGNCPVFVGSSSPLQKELIALFLGIFS
jgi:hypothetical protein